MDLLRVDTVDGPIHFRPEDFRTLCPLDSDPNKSVMKLVMAGHVVDLILPYDADEVAAQFETNYPACRVWRLS